MTKTLPIPTDATLNKWGVPACPECGRNDFKHRKTLGTHRRLVHKIAGQSKSATRAREIREQLNQAKPKPGPKGGVQCPKCSRTFKNPLGLSIHLSTLHGIAGAKHKLKAKSESSTSQIALAPMPSTKLTKVTHDHSTNGRSPEPPLNVEDLAVFQAIGEVKGLCRAFAEQAGIPTVLFTGRVISALLHQTRRGRLGNSD